ncbi:carbonic anhydrase [Oscillatoria salina]|uniref:carbonic anhydrase n=1 Tax=Oscillatoria salina TaxID=331517 RepID=UPI0013B728DB|nr:carbonic anhydrase family protein [Oscillatoria salina]MBZ8178931.1 carbonic anhydrase family protein [Oscillatoria salina IIICB1]NET90967.1 carbonic anhydrase family protein [Kamptonema sp. SIO1D9]
MRFDSCTTSCLNILALGFTFLVPLVPSGKSFAQEVEWTYGGQNNPTHWGELNSDFQLCEVGRDQSPINITEAIPVRGESLETDYQTVPLEVFNNGHTIRVNYAPGSLITINGRPYELVQFHFHTPSEHYLNDKAAAMELHLVHRDQNNQLAVLGVMITEGEANETLAQIWQNFPQAGEKIQPRNITINASNLLPNQRNYYHYQGSLTTPPCSEGVSWNVLVEPITASPEQIEQFMKLYQYNARPIQPLNGRQIQIRQ